MKTFYLLNVSMERQPVDPWVQDLENDISSDRHDYGKDTPDQKIVQMRPARFDVTP